MACMSCNNQSKRHTVVNAIGGRKSASPTDRINHIPSKSGGFTQPMPPGGSPSKRMDNAIGKSMYSDRHR